jgi:hypothetical protein
MSEAVREIQKEWGVISNAPWLFVLAVAASLGFIWYVVNFLKSSEFAGLREQLNLKSMEVNNLRALIRDLRPSATDFQLRSNEHLRDDASSLARDLRRFFETESGKEQAISEQDMKVTELWGPDQSSLLGHHAEMRRLSHQRQTGMQAAYRDQFKVRAIMLRDEIVPRLPALPPGGGFGLGGQYYVPDFKLYDGPTTLAGLNIVADNLETLGRLLPVQPDTSADKPVTRSVISAWIARSIGRPRGIRQKP